MPMNEFWLDLIYYGFWGAVLGLLFAPFLFLLMLGLAYLFPKSCPNCGSPLPKIRVPTSMRQALRGGWTCGQCGCEVDRRGQRIAGGNEQIGEEA
jgi:hypothetical protein